MPLKWRRGLTRIRAKREKRAASWDATRQTISKWLNVLRILESKELRFHIIWNKDSLSVVYLPVKNCVSGKKESLSSSNR